METGTGTQKRSAADKLRAGMQSPLSKALGKISEKSDVAVTYRGVFFKTGFLLLMIVVGIAVMLVINTLGPQMTALSNNANAESNGFRIVLENATMYSTIGAGVALIVFIVAALLGAFIKSLSAVFGTLYCASVGYLISYMAVVVPDYKMPIMLALLLTIAVVAGLLFLYSTGKIRVTQKLRTVVFASIIAMLLGSVFVVICSFIPGLNYLYTSLMQIPGISIAFSAIGVIIACLFLLVDFDNVQNAVENQLPKKYEWFCAYTLAFSVIWLYFKILELILKAVGNAKK